MPILLIEHGHSIYFYLVLKLQMNFIIIKNMKEPLSKPINPQKHAVWCDHCGKLIPKLTLKNNAFDASISMLQSKRPGHIGDPKSLGKIT